MTIGEAKEYLKSILDFYKNVPEHMRDCTGVSISLKNIKKLYIAISQEKAEQENPLTIKQLKQINKGKENRQWVWIEQLMAKESLMTKGAYYQSKYDDDIGTTSFYCGYPGSGYVFDYADYGNTWLAYRSKPTEGQ